MTLIDPDVFAGGILTVPEQTYHADPDTLSVSGMKTLLRSPARFLHERTHPRPATQAMDTGSIAHELLLHGGDGRVRVLDAYDWRKPAIRDERDRLRAEGLVVIHRGQLRDAARMRRAVLRNPYVADIFSTGVPEQSLYWTDPVTEIACRGRVDWLREDVIVDLKTTDVDVTDDEALARVAASFDWPMQAAHYVDGYEQITGDRLPFLFVVVQRDEPYFTRVLQPTTADLEAGREKVAIALARYADYQTNGWPTYGHQIEPLPIAPWYGR